MNEFRRVALQTGVTLNVALAGEGAGPAIIFLHGFPESNRTWREVAPRLEESFYLIMPDQRGFAGSDRPQEVESYEMAVLVEDVFALADALEVERFALVGHDWGGVVAWSAAIKRSQRLTHLAIINAPHPVIFQKHLFENEDQRRASQYISAFRTPFFEELVEARGYDWFFERTFAAHVDLAMIPETEKQRYIAQWSQPGAFKAMLNWYRAARLIVPPVGVKMPLPDWLLRAFPRVKVPTLVVWGLKDTVLLSSQLNGLDELVDELTVVRLGDAGHFTPWEAGENVASALLAFLDQRAEAGVSAF